MFLGIMTGEGSTTPPGMLPSSEGGPLCPLKRRRQPDLGVAQDGSDGD